MIMSIIPQKVKRKGEKAYKTEVIGSKVELTVSDILYYGLLYSLLLVLLGMALLPFFYVLSVSFWSATELFGDPHWIPKDFTLTAWKEAIDILAQPLINSFIIATGTSILSLLIVIPGAYVFGRKDLPGLTIGFYLIVLSLLFPYIILVIPIMGIWFDTGLYNTIPGLWIAYQAFITPFALWILRDYFEKLPVNLEEAARVYGCTQFTAFRKVILPLARPAIIAVGFLSFLVGWNDFLFSNMLTTGQGPRPAVVALFISTVGGERQFWSRLMAETLIIGTPPTVLYMIARQYLSDAFAV